MENFYPKQYDKDSYFILNKMQMNSVLIDPEGVFELELKK